MSIELAVLTSVILALLAGASAFFSGIETALFSITGFQVRRWREREPAVAEQFTRLMVNPRRVLSVILLTDTLINIPLIVLALVFINAIPVPAPNWVKALVNFRVHCLCLRSIAEGPGSGESVSILEKRDSDYEHTDADRGAVFAFPA